LIDIPHGKTRSYGEIARELGLSPRHVGQACGRNPIPILIPCHRVVGADGALTGFSAPGGIETKRKLLQLEGALLI
jgi:methylated-DNA-[protein]-cysteine S-methyltransferase